MSFSKIIDVVSKKLAKWRSKSIKIDLKINIENYLKFSSKNVGTGERALGGGAHPISKDGSPPATRFADTGVRKTVRPHCSGTPTGPSDKAINLFISGGAQLLKCRTSHLTS